MKLQLADGFIERPIGVLENIVVSLCGFDNMHTFAVVHFAKNTNYLIISRQPFMSQFKMV